MPANTYVELAKITPSGSLNAIVMDSIPGTYTDLILVGQYSKTTANSTRLRFNNDSSSGFYSQTILYGNGTSAASGGESNQSAFFLMDYLSASTSSFHTTVTHIQNYAATNKNKVLLERGGNAAVGTTLAVGLWRNNAAITRIDVNSGAGTFSAGTTFSLYGIKTWVAETSLKATGGYVYSDTNYWYHAFLSSSTFTPNQSITADILVVAGGGAGGTGGDRGAGGGGAGGLLAFTSQSLTATTYTCTVGAGGAAGAGGGGYVRGSNGSNSQFGALTSVIGGGAGGTESSTLGAGLSGGSGGGGGGSLSGAGTGGANTSGQGFAGGNGFNVNSLAASGGGGGGAGAAGANAGSSNPTAGGVGVATYSSWGIATQTGENVSGTVYYAGGGAGAGGALGRAGGLGGGGASTASSTPGTSGLVTTGGGGGGNSLNATPGSGGSGVIIVRYAK